MTKAWVGDKVDENLGAITGVGGVFGDLINKALKELTGIGTDKVISKYLDVKNYVVCSVGRMSIGDNEEKMVSLGVFGHVFTFGKEDIEKAWTRAMDDYESRNHVTPPPAPQPQQDEDEESLPEEDAITNDPMALPDSIMGVEIPEGMDSMVNQMANEAPNSKSTNWVSKEPRHPALNTPDSRQSRAARLVSLWALKMAGTGNRDEKIGLIYKFIVPLPFNSEITN